MPSLFMPSYMSAQGIITRSHSRSSSRLTMWQRIFIPRWLIATS